MKPHTIIITGGHLTPAIATIEEMQRRGLPLRILFIGRTHATEYAKNDMSYEKEQMQRLGVPFFAITTGRIQRFFSVRSIVSILKIPVGVVQALLICIRERPACIVSFGGYVALPVVLSSWFLRIPCITHEQTSVMGLANRVIAHIAKKICVTFPELLTSIPKQKGTYTGLPIRAHILSISRQAYRKKGTTRNLLYITGGSTGATSVNELVYPILDRLTMTYDVIHQTGRLSYDTAIAHKQSLPALQQEYYKVYAYVPTDTLKEIFHSVALVVGRSGANTTIEMATLGIPAIFIPLPWSGGGEQLKNAQWLASKGSAIILNQSEISPDILLKTILSMTIRISTFQKHATTLASSMPRDGASHFVDEILSLL